MTAAVEARGPDLRAAARRYAVRGLGAAGLAMAVAVLRRTWRELAAYRADHARLGTAWITIPGIAGGETLRIHARLHEHLAGADVRGPAPVVLVHGFGVSGRYLVPLAARLAGRTRVYAPDLPGHGYSDRDARPLTASELAGALAAWMDAWELRGAVLVGHSFGAQIVAEVAVRRPELAAGLVLIGPVADPRARSAVGQIVRGGATAPFERPSFFGWAALDYLRAGVRLLATEMREMLAYRLEAVLPQVVVPVRVVRGAHDHIAPQRWVEDVARAAGAPPPVVVARWGHAVQYDAPAAVAAVVLDLART